MTAPACRRCTPHAFPVVERARLLGIQEQPHGCACLIDCGKQGCTGEPVPVISKEKRAHIRKDDA